jgi:peptidoglycan/LPS O-acetylase OafA/YrhL
VSTVTGRGYRPELDGVRAIAIAGVMAVHLALSFVHAGALGVDVFFVLSGYLITGLLVTEQSATGRIDLRAFYLRRVARLYPALLAMLVGAAIIEAVAFHASGSDIAFASLISATYVTDIVTYTHNTTWLLYAHTWSLSIEEHFYLIWPSGLALARGRRINLGAVALCAAVVFLVFGCLLASPPHQGLARDYFQPQAHAFGILLGCFLALRPVPRWARFFALPCLAGIVALIVAGPTSSDAYIHVGIPLAGLLTFGLIAGLEHSQLARQVLSVGPLRRLGVISYGLYLYHPFVFATMAKYIHVSHNALIVPQVIVALAIAELSYRFYESPIRARARHSVGFTRGAAAL